MKSVIYEFDPVIYPTRLWVSKKPDAKDVEALFYPFDSNGNVVDSYGDTFDNPDSFANTIIVGNKKSRWRGCLVSIFRPGGCGAGVCSHEAFHFMTFLCENLGISMGGFDDSEHLAYLEQWATNCIYSVLRGHPEQMKGVKVE